MALTPVLRCRCRSDVFLNISVAFILVLVSAMFGGLFLSTPKVCSQVSNPPNINISNVQNSDSYNETRSTRSSSVLPASKPKTEAKKILGDPISLKMEPRLDTLEHRTVFQTNRELYNMRECYSPCNFDRQEIRGNR